MLSMISKGMDVKQYMEIMLELTKSDYDEMKWKEKKFVRGQLPITRPKCYHIADFDQ